LKPGEGAFPWVKLSRVASTGTGHTPSRSRKELWRPEELEIPWFTLADVGQLRDDTKTVVYETAERISPAGVANSSAVVHPSGTVLLSRTASVGFSAVMGQPMAVSQDFMTWTPGPKLRSRFLLYALRGLRPELRRLATGSTHKTIYMPDLLALKAPLPPLPAQEAIAEFLDEELSRLGRARHRARELAERALEPVLADVEAEFDRHAQGRIGYRFEVQLGKKLYEDRVDHDTAEPYLRNANVHWDRLELDDLKVMNFEGAEREKYRLRRGDLLVCEARHLGRSAVWEGQIEPCFFQMALNRVRPLNGDSTRWVMWCLRILNKRNAWAGDDVNIPHLPAEKLRATRIPLPSPEQQHALVARFDAAAARARKLESTAQRLEALLAEYRDSLIAEAVTGQLDVTRASEAERSERAHAALEGAGA
jgi:type I restriction enzyme, S subunit